MSMKRAAGVLYGVTALVSGYLGLRMIFTPSSGGRFFWWPLIMFGAPILLLVGSILTIFPQVRKIWLVALAGTILFLIWVAFMRDFSGAYLIFAVALIVTTWAAIGLASALRRPVVVALGASLILTMSWIPGSFYAFRATLSAVPPIANALVLLPLLVLWALIIASLITGAMLWRSSGARRPVQLAAPPATTTQ